MENECEEILDGFIEKNKIEIKEETNLDEIKGYLDKYEISNRFKQLINNNNKRLNRVYENVKINVYH